MDRKPGLLRDSVTIVVTGTVLGLAFNALGLSARPPRGLAWVPGDAPMQSVETLTQTGADAPVAASTRPSPVLAVSPRPPVSPRAAVMAPAPARSEAMESPAPASRSDLPAIPDVGRPLEVSRATVAALVEADAALVVDAREQAEFDSGHIPGAVSVPYEEAKRDPERLRALDPKGRPIVVYCSGGDCEASKELAEVMVRDYSLRRVLVYKGGFPDWTAAGSPVARTQP